MREKLEKKESEEENNVKTEEKMEKRANSAENTTINRVSIIFQKFLLIKLNFK